MDTSTRGLGRREPTDNVHLEKYPLTATTMPTKPVPVSCGSNWYQGFDTPVQRNDGAWLPEFSSGTWGNVRGGHEWCLKPPSMVDLVEWWRKLDQGNEGACVGYALTRMMMLLNRKTFNPNWLYEQAKIVDEWPGENYDGTSGRAGCDVLRTLGHVIWRGEKVFAPVLDFGISANRWATSVDDIARCLDPEHNGQRITKLGYVTLLNSWGQSYPHYTKVSLDTLDRLVFRENGDATMVADR